MAGEVQKRLADLEIVLPEAAKPRARYVPFVRTGDLIFVSGQGPVEDDVVKYIGKVGADLSLDDGIQAARMCALNLLAQVREACDGDLDRVKRIVRIAGLVNCAPDFTQHAQVIDGASVLLGDVFGEIGTHARIATGAGSLPNGMAVELEGVFEVE